jgi:hypothetical protein
MFFENNRREAYEVEKAQAKQSSVSATLAYMFGKYILAPLVKLAITYFLSILWVAFLLFMASKSMWLGLLAAAIVGAAVYFPQTRILSIVGPFIAQRARKKEAVRIAEGNDLLRMTGIVSTNDETEYRCEAYEDDKGNLVLRVLDPLYNITSEDVINRLNENLDKYNVKRIIQADDDEAWLKILLFTTDPLEEDQTIYEPLPLDEEAMKVVCAVDSVGEQQAVSFKNVSGMTVAGVPGSGKTAGLTSFLLPVALSEDVELNIIDGKGGHDWAAYKPICAYYSNDDEDLQAMKDYLEAAVEDMRERVQTMPAKLGVANFWSASIERRRAAGVKHKIIVIDECQNYFEKRAGDKEATALTQEIVRLTTSLVKKGRSAGITLIATTQKPTADSLPTGLRDNCALKICFRVTTREAQKAALGDVDLDDSNNALSINKAGGAVLLSENGNASRVRFFYMAPSDQERLINDEAARRKTP